MYLLNWDVCWDIYMHFLYLHDINYITVIHGLMSAGVCLLALRNG